MTWVRIDDGFAQHPKIAAAGPLAALVQVRALCYANRYLTNGFIPTAAVPSLTFGFDAILLLNGGGNPHSAGGVDWGEWMVKHELWETRTGGYFIHDFFDFQLSKIEVEALREERAKAGRKGGKSSWRKRKEAKANASANAQANAYESGSKRLSKSEAHTRTPSPIKKELRSRIDTDVRARASQHGTAPGRLGDLAGSERETTPDLAAIREEQRRRKGYDPPTKSEDG